MNKEESRLYEFDRFCLDASARILLHNQQEAPLTPKVFEPLAMFSIALAHVALGLNDKAFEWLNRAAESGSLSYYTLQRDSKLDPLRSDPRFESLRRRLKSRRQIG